MVKRPFCILPGVARACTDFCDPTAVSRFNDLPAESPIARDNRLTRKDIFDPGHPATSRVPNHRPDPFHEWLRPVEDGLEVASLKLKKGINNFLNSQNWKRVQ